MDTVEPAKGKKAVSHEDGTVTSDGTTVLGADDLAGVTAIYEAVRHLIETKTPHRPIEILISTGEELYCKGANAFDYSQVQAKEAYVLDLSGAIGAAAYAAPTLVSFAAKIQGKAAHAGFHPEDGINSIQAAAHAIAQLPQGHVDESTTANIGKIGGGSGTNIVSESCVIEGEIRSLNHETAMELLETYHRTFQLEEGILFYHAVKLFFCTEKVRYAVFLARTRVSCGNGDGQRIVVVLLHQAFHQCSFSCSGKTGYYSKYSSTHFQIPLALFLFPSRR